ncbi:NAD(P) transhydrogenase subunit alpha [Dactylosporangium vinaceum]|uniref:proton-translocating NAD(P)(+) transhydrogenase n=1 Tax=Dactylosporangium vinaceum TaxID=53362 RepID=A0ABV5MCR3_9ACTN|nr:NAD(P) transhydrogenase subunit alpha [Dactylosporangium vinaceum]UAC00699.1 NAD(P) transhydrogenase subunit alpha [Dactylosporangium vinaceum]
MAAQGEARRVGVVRERGGERRVALTPPGVALVRALGFEVVVQAGAGWGAWHSDDAYRAEGAEILDGPEFAGASDILVCVAPPDPGVLRPRSTVVGLLGAERHGAFADACAGLHVTALSLDRLPRTLSRAQPMDALTSQAAIAGYRAALLAAGTFGGYFPMLMTAAGTVKPATVLVLGTGVAGLAAIGTARRIGAAVTGYDIRPEAADEVRSLGARFLDVAGPGHGSSEGGYARALTAGEADAQRGALQERIAGFDVIITTARVPGRTPPLLVTADAVKAMRPGSVVVDAAAGDDGGNVEGSVAGRTVVTAEGVTVIGAANPASDMAPAASALYCRNITAVLELLAGPAGPDRDDEIIAAIAVTRPEGESR